MELADAPFAELPPAGAGSRLPVCLDFLAANLGTSSRSPVIWQDEVMFTDPAANLYFGQGFTTSAWFQSRDTLFAGNSPLYSLCLYPWIRVFGFDVVSVRGLNYGLILAVAAVCLLALDRLGLVRSTVPRLVFALLVLCGDGVTYSYRSGRYDCLGMLLVSGLFLTLTLRPCGAEWPACSLLAACPWAGLQLLPYLALLGLLVLVLVWNARPRSGRCTDCRSRMPGRSRQPGRVLARKRRGA